MSSRALRKAREERDLLRLQEEGSDEDSEEIHERAISSRQKSAFSMLEEEETIDDSEPSGEDEPASEKSSHDNDKPRHAEEQRQLAAQDAVKAAASAKKKKRKKKAKSKSQEAPARPVPKSSRTAAGLDEIDKALQSLSASDKSKETSITLSEPVDTATLDVCQFLTIDTHHLQVGNEMRRLFGRAAVDAEREAQQQESASRRRANPGDSVGLVEAIAGRNALGGPGVPAVLRRRNIFVQGREDWPRASGGGLGMEIVERRPGGIVEYKFTHGPGYQSSQHEFETCVKSYDPSLLVNLLRFIPYHVSTLLQVSEIAKQEKDYATAGELLERALFSFGRAVHSSFAANLAQGKARLDFRRPENREFWLAAWRYIGNISMRATWRTAYEWARLLLSLDPEKDPYCISLIIDQLALRSKQAQNFLDLSRSAFFAKRWAGMANIFYSQALASRQTDKDQSKAEDALIKAMKRFPWVGARLFKELDISKIPPAIWGQTASSPVDILHCELYVTQAIDLWKLPETSKFLVDSASAIGKRGGNDTPSPVINARTITRDEARHVVLTDKPALIGLLPHSITSQVDSVSDPLPPDDNLRSYSTQIHDRVSPETMVNDAPGEFIRELDEQQRFFDSILPVFLQPGRGGARNGSDSDVPVDERAVAEALHRTGISMPQLTERMQRLISLREALSAQPDRRVVNGEGDEIVMLDDGRARTRFHADRFSLVDHDDDALLASDSVNISDGGDYNEDEGENEAVPPPIRGNR